MKLGVGSFRCVFLEPSMTIYGGEDGEQRHASMKPIQTQVYILITANRLREHSSVNGKNWTIDSLKSWLVCLVGVFVCQILF